MGAGRHEHHRWRFFRAGGFDQVRLERADDLLALGSLDQKLWLALSCPVRGTEFDARTLALMDTDNDGHLRAPELIAAAEWAGARLRDPELLVQGLDGIPPVAIRDDDEAGAKLAATARALAADLGKTESDPITVAEASAASERFAAKATAAWQAAGGNAQPLGDGTAAAFEAFQAVSAKIEDYFARCRLAAFDSRAGAALNGSEEAFQALAAGMLSGDAQAVAGLPLARVEAGRALPLAAGVNPAWRGALERLRELAVVPLLGDRESLSEGDWQSLQNWLAPYAEWMAAKPDPTTAGDETRELERLVRYVRDLLPLANNYVAFRDFYTRKGKATFQAGTLYLDGRSCELCVTVADAAKHAALANLARICLVYCDCVRGAERMTIAAAITAGDADQLMAGRNGVFYDRQGRDWDATVVRLIDHPISLRQAFWSPYKRLVRLVGEQLQKLAANKAKEAEDKMAAAAAGGAKAVAPAGKEPPPFDMGKFAGIFAAIGLAVGALGTALASILTGLFALAWWQVPLAIAGLLLAISAPAVILAAFKLRNRNLGPLLDANGWAINARARINIPFGRFLTQVATLPPGSERSLLDPGAERKPPWLLYFSLLVLALLLAWYFHF